MKDFFVSYNKADRTVAEWITQQLQDAGYTTVIQAEDMPPGSNFVIEMDKAVKEARRTIAVLSPDYLTSLYTQPEWAVAFRNDPTGAKGLLLPVRVRECTLEGLLGSIVYIDLVGKNEAASQAELLDGIKGKAKLPTPFPVDELVKRYCDHLRQKVSTVRIFGASEPHQLDQVFVELTINEEYDRRPNQAEFLGLMDAELRRRRSVFGDAEQYRDRAGVDDDNQRGLSHLSTKTEHTIKPDDLLRPHTHAIVTGAPGCGKTTLLHYLAWQTLQAWRTAAPVFVVPPSGGQVRTPGQSPEGGTTNAPVHFPVFLEFKKLDEHACQSARNKRGQLDFARLLFDQAIAVIIADAEEHEYEALFPHFRAWLTAGQVAVFLDGLDEVNGRSFFTALRESVNTFLTAYGNNIVIISTRPFALTRFADAKEMEILPLNPRQIEQFIAHYYHPASQDAPARQQFQHELQRRRELRELARVPALLGFILQLWRKRGSVADDKLELYEQITRELAAQLDREKEGIAPEREWLVADKDGSLKLDLLRQLAFNGLFRGLIHPPYEIGGTTNDVARLVFTSEQLRAEAAAFAHAIKQREGITINPRHLAEDVKATALLRQVGTDHYAFAHLTLQEYLAAWQLAKRDNGDTCERIFCRAYFNPTLAEMEVLPVTLGLVDEPDKLYKALEQLPESLDFKELRLRVRGLSYTDKLSHRTFSDLLATLRSLKDGSKDPKQLGYQRAVWLSLNGLRQCWLGSVAKEILYSNRRLHSISLYGLRDLSLLKKIREMLNDSSGFDRALSSASWMAVGRKEMLGDLSSFNQGHLRMEIDLAINLVESDALSIIEEPSGFIDNARLSEARAEELLASLKHQDFDVRWRAASELGNFRTAQVKTALLEALSDQSLFVRRRAAESLGKIGGAEVVLGLIPLLKDKVSGVRLRAATELRKLADNRILKPMLDALEDESQHVRAEAIQALGLVGDYRTVDKLLLEVKCGIHSVLAAEAIGKLSNRHLSEGLTRAFCQRDNYVRGRAIEYIGYYDGTVETHQKLLHVATYERLKGVRNIANKALARYERKLQYFDIPIPTSTTNIPS